MMDFVTAVAAEANNSALQILSLASYGSKARIRFIGTLVVAPCMKTPWNSINAKCLVVYFINEYYQRVSIEI